MRDKDLLLFSVKTTSHKTSFAALRWALASLRLHETLNPATTHKNPEVNSLAFKGLSPFAEPKIDPRFVGLTFAALEQRLVGTYLKLAFHFFETLKQAQFALFFKTQKGLNRKKSVKRPQSILLQSKTPKTTPQFAVTQKHTTAY